MDRRNLRIASLLFGDDVVLLASSVHDHQHALERSAAEHETAEMGASDSESEEAVHCWENRAMLSLGWEREAASRRVSSNIMGSHSRVLGSSTDGLARHQQKPSC